MIFDRPSSIELLKAVNHFLDDKIKSEVPAHLAFKLRIVENVLNIELNSVTDNPLVVDNNIVSGGNFHGQPVAIPIDYNIIAASELGNISDRRTYLLLKGNNSMAMYISNTNFKLDDVICSIIVRGGENIQVTFIQNQTFLVEKVASMKGFELLFRKVF